jgi:ABC-type phosphate transport system substrate-binding protein
MAELAGVMVGNYFLLECLTREGMVETYRARPITRGGYDVVLRLFRPPFTDPTDFREHFSTEVEKVWRCHHPHVIPLLEFGSGNDLLFTATLFPETETLAQFLERQQERQLPIAFVMRLVTQLCSAVQHAHDQDIVHGNIQPSSIFVSNDGDVLLTNFSMRRAYQDGEPLAVQLDEGNALYAAPEQGLGMVRPVGDIYSLGVLLYRLLTGILPYTGETPGEIALKHADNPVPSVRALRAEVSEALEQVVHIALAKVPEARFPRADALTQALLDAVVTETPPIVSHIPRRHIHVQSRRLTSGWARAMTLLSLALLLFRLLGTSIFVFSLPQHLYESRNPPFWNSIFNGTPISIASTVAITPIASSKNQATPSHNTVSGKGTATATGQPSVTAVPGATVTPKPSATVSPSTPCVAGSLSIDGSPALEPLLQQVANDYQASCSGAFPVLNGSGIRPAFKSLQQNQIDMAASDMTATPAWNFTDHPIFALLYAIIVNPDVQVRDLSSTVLQDISQGHIANWSQLGGPKERITLVLRPAGDPANIIFRAFLLNSQIIHGRVMRLQGSSSDMVIQAVNQTPGAVGFVPLMAALGAKAHMLSLDGVVPSVGALMRSSYAFWSVEHLYTRGDGTAQALAYVQFLNTTQEAGRLEQLGAVPVSMLQQSVLASHLPGPQI